MDDPTALADDLRRLGMIVQERGAKLLVSTTYPGALWYAYFDGRLRLALDYDGWSDCGHDAASIATAVINAEAAREKREREGTWFTR